jgi:hypothetical protein
MSCITVTVLDCTPSVRHENCGDNAVAAPCPDPVLPQRRASEIAFLRLRDSNSTE